MSDVIRHVAGCPTTCPRKPVWAVSRLVVPTAGTAVWGVSGSCTVRRHRRQFRHGWQLVPDTSAAPPWKPTLKKYQRVPGAVPWGGQTYSGEGRSQQP
jgi:hypothetical protein